MTSKKEIERQRKNREQIGKDFGYEYDPLEDKCYIYINEIKLENRVEVSMKTCFPRTLEELKEWKQKKQKEEEKRK